MKLNDLHNLMDDLARQIGPSESDLEAREAELHAAIDAHPEWMSEMRMRDAFDVRLCEVMPQVELPTGLKERLLAAVDEQQSPAEPVPAADRERRSRRRAFGLFMAATSMCVLGLWLALNPLTSDLTVSDVANEMPELWDSLDTIVATSETVASPVPSGGWDRLQFPHDWKAYAFSDTRDQPLAFRKLEFLSRHGRLHTGLLGSLPLSSFKPENRPSANDPFSAVPQYLTTTSGIELAIVSWTDLRTERVYFLAIPTEDGTLKALEQLLYVQPV